MHCRYRCCRHSKHKGLTELLFNGQIHACQRSVLVRVVMKQPKSPGSNSSFFANAFGLVKQTGQEFLEDKGPQLGAALAYYTVFSLAPLILVILAVVGIIFRNDPAGAWEKITQQMSYFLDSSAVQVVQNIAQEASQPGKSTVATIMGVALALFGASGVFGQLQDALNTIWDVKAKPSRGIWGFLRNEIPFVCDGRGHLLSVTRLTHAGKPAQSLQPLRAICFARRSCRRDEHLSHIRFYGHCSAFRDDI